MSPKVLALGASVLAVAVPAAFVAGRASAPVASAASGPTSVVTSPVTSRTTVPPVAGAATGGSGPLASPIGRAAAAAGDRSAWRSLGVVEFDDVTVRLHEHPTGIDEDSVSDVWSSGWQPPGRCRPSRSVTLQVSGPTWVRTVALTRDGVARFGGRDRDAVLAGLDEGDPRWIVAVVLGSAASPDTGPDPSVTLSVARSGGGSGGGSGSLRVPAVTRDGIAVAVFPAAPDAEPDELTVEDVSSGVAPAAGPEGCEPPVVPMPRRDDAATAALTPSGDTGALQSTVREVVGAVLGGRRGMGALAAAIDDPGPPGEFAVVEQQAARAGRLGGMLLAPQDWVVVGPDRVVVRYDVYAREAGVTWWDRFAVLVRRDGVWRLSRDSVCEFVLLASAGCPGWRLDQGPTTQAVEGRLTPS